MKLKQLTIAERVKKRKTKREFAIAKTNTPVIARLVAQELAHPDHGEEVYVFYSDGECIIREVYLNGSLLKYDKSRDFGKESSGHRYVDLPDITILFCFDSKRHFVCALAKNRGRNKDVPVATETGKTKTHFVVYPALKDKKGGLIFMDLENLKVARDAATDMSRAENHAGAAVIRPAGEGWTMDVHLDGSLVETQGVVYPDDLPEGKIILALPTREAMLEMASEKPLTSSPTLRKGIP